MAVISIPQVILNDPLETALGLLSWNFNPINAISANNSGTQILFGILVPTLAGQSYTGVKLQVDTAGTSTAPTGFFVGIASTANVGSAGTMLAQSNDLHASASLTTAGIQSFAFNATYVETATGLRYILILQNGAFAGTNVSWRRTTPFNNISNVGVNQFVTAGTGITALQANGNAVANVYSTSSTQGFWAALY